MESKKKRVYEAVVDPCFIKL